MYSFWGFRSIDEEVIFIVVLSVILVILLLCEHWQKRLEKKQKDLENLWK